MRRRNVANERLITRLACGPAIPNPTSLIEFAEERACNLSGEYVPNPGLVRVDRDRPRDVREELADARNHLVWWIEDHPDDPTTSRKLRALQHICLAYTDLLD